MNHHPITALLEQLKLLIQQRLQLMKETELRDDDWHQPKAVRTNPDKIKDISDWCDYMMYTINKYSLREVGKHDSPEIIIDCS